MKCLIAIFATALLCVSIASAANETNKPAATAEASVKLEEFKQPGTLAELLALPPDQIEKVDIARMNLLCAEGLRGSEDLDIQQCLKMLDVLAEHVRAETERSRHFFVENPERFKNSEGRFRMMYLATVLQQDFGVQYSPERKDAFVTENGKTVRKQSDDVFFADSKDIFIHGLLTGKHYGTCASMPLLYVAIAKRLGYPVHLATTQAHGYVRYEEGTNHFNVEATSVGFKTYPDAFYKNWPFPLSDEFIKQGRHLESLDNKMVLAHCLTERASCLTSMKKFDEAREAWNQALRYLPDTPLMRRYFESAKFQREKSQWFMWWDEVDRLAIPEGPKFSYFQNMKVRVHMFMNYSCDMDETGKVVAKLKEEVAEYQRQMSPFYDGPRPLSLIWPENLDALPEFPSETVSMPSLAASPGFWQAIPPEWAGQLQLLGVTKEEDVLMEVTRLSLSARQQTAQSDMNALLPPQVQQAMRLAETYSRPPSQISPLGMSPRLVEAFTRLADNEQFRMTLSQYHTAKLRQLEKEIPTPTFQPTVTISHNGTVRVPERPFRPRQPMDDERNPNAASDELRRRALEQEKSYHLQSIRDLVIKRLPQPAELNHAP